MNSPVGSPVTEEKSTGRTKVAVFAALAVLLFSLIYAISYFWPYFLLLNPTEKYQLRFLGDISNRDGSSNSTLILEEKRVLSPNENLRHPRVHVWTGFYWKEAPLPRGKLLYETAQTNSQHYLVASSGSNFILSDMKYDLLEWSDHKLLIKESLLVEEYHKDSDSRYKLISHPELK